MSDRLPIQFRIGAQLLARIRQSIRTSGDSQNAWLTAAIKSLLRYNKPHPLCITAESLLANKHTLTVRLLPDVVSRIDKICRERRIPRTVWLLDACMTRIHKDQ